MDPATVILALQQAVLRLLGLAVILEKMGPMFEVITEADRADRDYVAENGGGIVTEAAYINPMLNCASALPCSASGCHSANTVAA
jgi:hypothetical protein